MDQHRGSQSLIFNGSLVSVLLLAGVSVPFSIVVGKSHSNQTIALSLLLASLAAALPIYRLYHRSLDLCEPGLYFLAYYAIDFLGNLWADLSFGSRLFEVGPGLTRDLRFLNIGLIYATAGLLIWYVGYAAPFGRDLARALPSLPLRWRPRKALLVGWLLALGAVGLWGYAVSQAGGASAWLTLSKDDYLLSLHQGGIYQSLFSWELPVSAIALSLITQRISIPKRSTNVLIFALLMSCIVFGTSTGQRGWIPRAAMAWFLCVHAMSEQRGRPRVLRTVAFLFLPSALVFFALFQFVTAIRFGISPSGVESAVRARPSTIAVVALRFQGLDALAWITHIVPSRHPYEIGREFLDLETVWIPRALWPGKPISADTLKIDSGGGIAVEDPRDRTSCAFDIALLARMYLDFGPLGIFFGMLFVGVCFRFVFEFLGRAKSPSNAFVIGISTPMLAGLPDMDLFSLLTVQATALALLVVICLWIRE